ncbi:MAG: PstS family phosphate ABC transporter substrate-binding protein [Humidesulfovibrio sp.]|jgi:phosphate transport system substrate-binding protein|uniref:PstS family phosphate ABC transporter substrate-binding protein n=1 Tax=Humidesulfovibrio sp. TaxID=2910988 RepID=UPI002732D3EC|nr:PstS family phosphate ABC transporter substrate-binding protein [Humidesulfovibrio sp.]MDP2847651.1 PstS family phosphate ABC transporter substrate-binding protein [Humidesulfovibrio sp.]MDQ7835365.1 PstS family phosphate ABC transporter substrate-binding protein [Humidesulfovibrio sp.]
MKRLLSAALAALAVLGLAAVSFAGDLPVKGSTTVQPIMQKAVEAFMAKNKGVSISISASGSGDGAKALIDGSTPLAMMSREMKESEIKQAKDKGVNPKQIIIAYDCLTPIVHPSNPVKNLTMDQLKDIYTGKITDWKDVGGAAGPISVVSRDSSSGTFEYWNEHVLKKERVYARAQMQASNGAVAQTVSKQKSAIGYVGLAYTQNKGLKAVTVEGVGGSVENTLNGTYPISRGLYLYSNGEPTGDVAKLVNYILSDEGQKIVASVDYVPLKAAKAAKADKKAKK